MRVPGRDVLLLAILALGLAGCAPVTSVSVSPTPAETFAILVGSYSVEYHTTESDRDVITDESVTRDGEVTGSCSASQCDLAFTTELKASDGSVASATTRLTFDGATYRGTQASTTSCDGLRTLATVEDGLEYTSETIVTPSATSVVDGQLVVSSFDIVITEHNEITPAGREAGCLQINLAGPDPFASNTTTVGVGTRQP